ncbi:MAG TPA: polysaccharide deacetylase family protein [Candidatus Polarisedimenticolaceae bacterium]|nr:polysaccharide deacetylase family protein [Candidatus Polarisedimenticolaceae bacterium]
MRAVMYHYVRETPAAMPHFRYLHADNFRRQLDRFESEYRFVTRDEWTDSINRGAPIDDGILLTFDDGLSDHFEFVMPELIRRGLWGLFYVSTAPYRRHRLLDVHRIHCLLGTLGGVELLRRLRRLVDQSMLSGRAVQVFSERSYTLQGNHEATVECKRILNYYLSYDELQTVLDRLMLDSPLDETELVRRFYLGVEQIGEMHRAGMWIGSHSVNHRVMSRLSEAEQSREIRESFEFLEELLDEPPPRSFCYPYGIPNSFDATTERLLDRAGCDFSFSAQPGSITRQDLLSRRQALPRYDCNQLPHGTAHYGDRAMPADSSPR